MRNPRGGAAGGGPTIGPSWLALHPDEVAAVLDGIAGDGLAHGAVVDPHQLDIFHPVGALEQGRHLPDHPGNALLAIALADHDLVVGTAPGQAVKQALLAPRHRRSSAPCCARRGISAATIDSPPPERCAIRWVNSMGLTRRGAAQAVRTLGSGRGSASSGRGPGASSD